MSKIKTTSFALLNLEKVDFVYTCIATDGAITIENLLTKYSETVNYYNLDKHLILALIEKMLVDETIIKTGDLTFSINPLKMDFNGYVDQYLSKKSKEKIDKIIEYLFKITPLLLSVIFGVITVVYTILNYKLNLEKVRTPEKIVTNILIDSSIKVSYTKDTIKISKFKK